jgi:hypothetical protein
MEIVGLFGSCFSLPFVKPICRDQAPTLFEGSPEGGFRSYGFHPGVDHSRAYRNVLGPERHQSPVALLDVSLVLVDYNDGNFLGRSHVVVGLDFERGWVGVEIALKLTR